MKGFLGLCNYFRDHVRDYAQKVKPLHDMVVDYKKGKPLQWTQELKQRYEQVKEEVANCPTLFFLDPEAPVFVQTDASDYGMGAYIFQIIAGKECPTLFVSKSFSKQQQKWSASYYPMEVLNMDTIGPLKADEEGKEYILVIIDCFSRFVELYPVKSTAAIFCARALLNHIGRYGVPLRIRSDQGSQFVNETINELC
eukprot:gene19586-23732_t